MLVVVRDCDTAKFHTEHEITEFLVFIAVFLFLFCVGFDFHSTERKKLCICMKSHILEFACGRLRR